MEYRVKHKKSGEERTLSHTEVNDMDYDNSGRVVVFDTNMEPYFLIEDDDIN